MLKPDDLTDREFQKKNETIIVDDKHVTVHKNNFLSPRPKGPLRVLNRAAHVLDVMKGGMRAPT